MKTNKCCEKQKGNQCGIIGLSLGWLIPLAGFVLGIIALGRGESNKTYGVLSIIISVIAFIFWLSILG